MNSTDRSNTIGYESLFKGGVYDSWETASEGKDACYLGKLRRLFAKKHEGDRKQFQYVAEKMAGTRSRPTEGKQLIPADGV